MAETGPSYGEELNSFSGNFYVENMTFPGSITLKVSTLPWDFYFMVMNSLIKAKSCICKASFTKKE